jgi:hypothetical protein
MKFLALMLAAAMTLALSYSAPVSTSGTGSSNCV